MTSDNIPNGFWGEFPLKKQNLNSVQNRAACSCKGNTHSPQPLSLHSPRVHTTVHATTV